MTCEQCKWFHSQPHDVGDRPCDGWCRRHPQWIHKNKTTLGCGDGSTGKVRRVKASPEYSAEFKEFWEVYPNKKAQDAAWRAWRDEDKLPPQHYQLAIKQAQAYAEYVTDKELKHVKHPATWLNAGCWKDVLEKKIGSKACVDCGKAYQQGHKYTMNGRIKEYRCKECRTK